MCGTLFEGGELWVCKIFVRYTIIRSDRTFSDALHPPKAGFDHLLRIERWNRSSQLIILAMVRLVCAGLAPFIWFEKHGARPCKSYCSALAWFMTNAEGLANTFVIAKLVKDSQMEIWDGGALTQAAAFPPKPRLQANPTALAEVETSVERPLFASGSGARVVFDRLKVPETLRCFFSCPFVTRQELIATGFTSDELAAFARDTAGQ